MAATATRQRRAPIPRQTFGVLLALVVTLMFLFQVNIVEKLNDAPHRLEESESMSARHKEQPQQFKNALKKTSVHRKKPPPPAYSNESFANCKVLRPDDYIYEYGPWDAAPIVVESHKLVFFTIPKVGSTVLKQLFRRMEGYVDYLQDKHPLPHAPKRNGLKYLYDYPPVEADAIISDPSFTRAIFLRDPKERLLSAYLDKARQNAYVQFHCCDERNPKLYEQLECAHPREHSGPAAAKADTEEPLLSFKDFLTLLIPSCQDPHWEPQADRIDAKYWKYINFVGRMENVEKDTRSLLERIGAWDEFGASGWPNGHIFNGSATVSHKTGSSKRLEDYFTPEMDALAMPFLKRDYELPVWYSTLQ